MKSALQFPGALVLTFMLGLLLLGSCATASAPITVTPATASGTPSWPSPPAEARVRYLRSVSNGKDWGIKKSFIRRLIDTIFGSGKEHFVRPSGVAEHQGVLYVADPGAQALWILDAGQNRVEKVQRIGEEDLLTPVAVAVRNDGAVFLADSRLKKVFLLDRAGKFIGIAAQQGLERPAGLAYDDVGQRLYVADSVRDKIIVFAPDGSVIRSWGEPGSHDGGFNHPTHLALDQAGTLLVSDALNFRVQAFDADGHFLWKFGHHGDGSGDIASPKGVAADRDGHVFVVDALFDTVQIFDHVGNYLLGFGGQGFQPGQLWLPGGLYINSRNEIYVADTYNQRIQVLVAVPDATAKENSR